MPRGKRPAERSTSWSVHGIRVEINETKLGVVVRKDMADQLERILDRIKNKAKAIVESSFGEYSNTGRARDSIETTRVKKINQYAVGGSVTAGGAEAPYVKFIHEGAAPHIIRARPENPTGMLRFVWVKGGGKLVRTPSVNHPGIRNPVPFLTIAGASVSGVRVARVRGRR